MPFPETIRRLPKTFIGGAEVFVHDAGNSQVLFIEVPADHPPVTVPSHVHDAEWGIVIEGEITMSFADRTETHRPGMTHWIPALVPHSFRFGPGTSSIHYFVERRVPLS